MQLIFRSLTSPQRPTHPLLPYRLTLRFWCLMPKGERERVCYNLGGAHEMDSFFCVILHAFTFTLMHYVICKICVIVRLMWHVCSLPWYICHATWLCSFSLLPCFTMIQMSFTLWTYAYFISRKYIVLAWIICLTLLCSYCQLLIWAKHVENPTHLLYILEVV